MGTYVPFNKKKRWPTIYPCIWETRVWEGHAANLPIHLGEDGHLSTILFGRGWPPIYLSIYEGMAIYLPLYLGGDGCSSNFQLEEDWHLFTWVRNGHFSTILFGRGWSAIHPF